MINLLKNNNIYIRNFFKLGTLRFLPKILEFFKLGARKFHFPKYKKVFQNRFFYFSSSETPLLKFLKLRARKFHFPKYKSSIFPKYKKSFFEKIQESSIS